MQLETSFVVDRARRDIVELLARDETLIALLPGRSEIVASGGDRRTAATRYTALDRDGRATFHFHTQRNGDIEFRKECDGVVWRQLEGGVRVSETASGSRVQISLQGQTQPSVPEIAVKGMVEDQLLQMSEALEALL